MTIRSKAAAILATLVASATFLAPSATAAGMQLGNYDLWTNRYDRASWLWFISGCIPEKSPDCITVAARPRLQFYAYYGSKAWLVDGRYTFTSASRRVRFRSGWSARRLLLLLDLRF